MPGRVEEKFMDVLQNIEFALVDVYKAHDDMTDYDGQAAVNALLRVYQSEMRNVSSPALRLSPPAQLAYERVKAMCELRLGRSNSRGLKERLFGSSMKPIELADMVDCLKRIRRSIEMWNKEGGRRGYYDFVKEYVK